MDSQPSIHIFFIPFLARGHTIPLLETARLFAERGARCTFVTTPGNSSYILPTIDAAASSGLSLRLLLIPFPATAVGLPNCTECTDVLPSGPDNIHKFFTGIDLLQLPFKNLVAEHRPDCIVSDSTVFWPADLAQSLSIPHFQFCVFSPFSKCVIENIFTSGAHLSCPTSKNIGPLVGLPHPIELFRTELPITLNWPHVFERTREAEEKSCGVLFNSFDELAPDYVKHCEKMMPGKAKVFCVGPVQLHKRIANWEAAGIKNWLDSKETESVLYIAFGSECSFGAEQLREIALGLASCEHSFVWVVRGVMEQIDDWLPEEFRTAVQAGRGLMITEWAPQVAILNHRVTGGFMLHCGWNSVVEAVCAGLPVIAWPLHSEQFINERLVVEVMRIGVRILEGAEMRSVNAEGKGFLNGEAIKAAVDRLMGGGDEEVRAMRKTAKKYAELAGSAMEKGGSSYVNMSRVIEQINVHVKGEEANEHLH